MVIQVHFHWCDYLNSEKSEEMAESARRPGASCVATKKLKQREIWRGKRGFIGDNTQQKYKNIDPEHDVITFEQNEQQQSKLLEISYRELRRERKTLPVNIIFANKCMAKTWTKLLSEKPSEVQFIGGQTCKVIGVFRCQISFAGRNKCVHPCR